MRHLRAVVEVAAVGTAALSVPWLGLFAYTAVFNVVGACGIDLSFLDGLLWFLALIFPFAVGFYYGYRRHLQLHLVAAWIGWIMGGYASGALLWVTVMTHARIPPQKPLTSSLLAGWAIWIGLTLLPAFILALTTMWGQRSRLRRQR